MTNLEKYNKAFKETFNFSDDQLNDNLKFGEGEWDSLGHMELISALEDTFEIMFETDDITHFGGYENGKKILKKYGVEI